MGARTWTTGAVALLASTALAGCGLVGLGPESGGGAINRPVDLVVPFGPGGGADQVGRAVAKKMEAPVGVDFPVINVEGSTGNTGTVKMLSGRPGDSVSVLIQDTLATVAGGTSSFTMDEVRGVCRLQSMPSALMVRKGTFADWQALHDAAVARPGELKVATVGANSVDDVVLAATKEATGADMRAVPYSEPSERYAALLGGEVDVLYEQLGDVTQYLDSDDFVPVLIFSDTPVEGYEAVPLATDEDIPAAAVMPQFRGLVIHADTPDEIVDILSRACRVASQDPAMQTFQKSVWAADDSYQNADQFDRFLEDQQQSIEEQLQEYGISD